MAPTTSSFKMSIRPTPNLTMRLSIVTDGIPPPPRFCQAEAPVRGPGILECQGHRVTPERRSDWMHVRESGGVPHQHVEVRCLGFDRGNHRLREMRGEPYRGQPDVRAPIEDELRGRDRKRRAFAQEGFLKNVLIGRPRAEPDRATWCRHLGEPAVTEQPGIGAQGGQEPEAVTVPGKVGPVAFAYSAG